MSVHPCILFIVNLTGESYSDSLLALTTSCSACVGSHAIVVVTEWKEFSTYDYARMLGTMERPSHVFDGRNMLPHAQLRQLGFQVHVLGRVMD